MTPFNSNPQFWSLMLATFLVATIVTPIGELAARAAGY
jgi:hypothetical protein